jgi:hypothetical protein
MSDNTCGAIICVALFLTILTGKMFSDWSDVEIARAQSAVSCQQTK